MQEVYNFLSSNLVVKPSNVMVVAVSYGPDSMALLDVVKKRYDNHKIICVHVHHNHREESNEEALKLKDYCLKNNIIFEMMKIAGYHRDTFTEKEARDKRYAFFDNIMNKYSANYLFMAHHGDDLVETILMRLTRGSTVKGYAGIPLVSERNNYKIIRPFLYVTKEQIMAYCITNNISYAIDKSNDDESYTRNRYRKKVLPFLKHENKGVHKQYLKFSNMLLEYEAYVQKEVTKVYDEVVYEERLNVKALIENDELIIRKVAERYFLNHYQNMVDKVTSAHVNSVIRLIHDKKPNAHLSLPNNVIIVKDYNEIYFDKGKDYNDYCFVLDDYVSLPNGYVIERINKVCGTNYVTAFDSREVSLPLYVRNKLDGDKMAVLGLGGSKKIKDIFIDEKVSNKERKNYPVLVDSSGEILWLPGLKKSKYDKSKKGKYDIILKYHKEGKDDTAE